MTKRQSEFTFTINGGKERTIKTKSGLYVEAVAAIPAKVGIKDTDYPATIRIWVADLLPDYGPYDYYIEKPGAAVATLVMRWDGETIAAYS